jgi:GrpB-like predicted nucleotidyltransferase (UPF0157 family)
MPTPDRVIYIARYDTDWPARFSNLAAAMREALGDVAVRIDHIGSTSVPGLAAKPIIDMQVSVRSLEPVDPFRIPLESLGYFYRQNNPELTKRYFREPPGEPRTHIHVRRAGSFSEQYPLLFRDYLRQHPHSASEYENVKRQLAEQYPHDGLAYTNAKDTICWEIIHRADEWAQQVGWEPGPSDA